jgi:hypothetical protein
LAVYTGNRNLPHASNDNPAGAEQGGFHHWASATASPLMARQAINFELVRMANNPPPSPKVIKLSPKTPAANSQRLGHCDQRRTSDESGQGDFIVSNDRAVTSVQLAITANGRYISFLHSTCAARQR